jgi:hypothetical protein
MTGYIELFGEIGFLIKFETALARKNKTALFFQDPVHKKGYLTTAEDQNQIIEFVRQQLQAIESDVR